MALTAELLAQYLQGIHYGIAILARNAIWQLDDEEAGMLATAVQHCTDVFSLSVDPRILAVSELIGVMGVIYIPRAIALREAARTSARPDIMPDKAANLHTVQ